jgi:hypothetical protein
MPMNQVLLLGAVLCAVLSAVFVGLALWVHGRQKVHAGSGGARELVMRPTLPAPEVLVEALPAPALPAPAPEVAAAALPADAPDVSEEVSVPVG